MCKDWGDKQTDEQQQTDEHQINKWINRRQATDEMRIKNGWTADEQADEQPIVS